MLNKLNLLALILFRYWRKHLVSFILFFILVFLATSVLFVQDSIKKDLLTTLDQQADIVVQRYQGGHIVALPEKWIWEILEIPGVSKVEDRIYGRHFFEQPEDGFMIVGIDLFDKTLDSAYATLFGKIDPKVFLQKNSMIVGSGVKRFFDHYAYNDYYIFRPPDRSKVKVWFFRSLDIQSAPVANDTIFMSKQLARKVLAIPQGYVSDLAIDVSNQEEIETIRRKLIMKYFDARIITKDDINRFYTHLYNYKGGVFLILFLLLLASYLVVLYHRFSLFYKEESKEIALLRSMGYRIEQVITLKLAENFFVAFFAFIIGVLVAYVYVFDFGAPVIKEIFLGMQNFSFIAPFSPSSIEFGHLLFLFVLVVFPYLFVLLYPVFRFCIADPSRMIR